MATKTKAAKTGKAAAAKTSKALREAKKAIAKNAEAIRKAERGERFVETGDGVAAPSGKRRKEPRPPRASCLNAAAQIIGDLPMSAKDLIAEMGVRGLWTSPGGKTPEATLYAAIIREIAAKGGNARFRKHDRGLFVKNG